MGFVTCTCRCGHKAKVSEFAVGMTATCERCRQPLHITAENTAPYVEPPEGEGAGPEKKKPVGPVDADHCAQCGAAFRGDWDRYMTPSGRVCHICANQAQEGESQTLANQSMHGQASAPGTQPHLLDDLVEPEPEMEPAPPTLMDKFEEFKESRRFRIGLWVAALSVIGLALLVTFTDLGAIPDRHARKAQIEEKDRAQELEDRLKENGGIPIFLAMKAITLVFWFVPHFFALFIALKAEGRLPGNRWWITGAHVFVASLLLGVLVTVSWGVMGAFFGILGAVIAYVMAMAMLFFFYDLRFQGLMTYVLASVVALVAARFGEQLALGVLGLLVS